MKVLKERLCNFLVWMLNTMFSKKNSPENMKKTSLKVAHNWPHFFSVLDQLPKQASDRNSPKTEIPNQKRPLMQNWVFRLGCLPSINFHFSLVDYVNFFSFFSLEFFVENSDLFLQTCHFAHSFFTSSLKI